MAQVILNTIATAFDLLKNDVHAALHTQIGDSAQLQERIHACTQLLLQANQVHYFLYLALRMSAHNLYIAYHHYSSRAVSNYTG